MFSFWQLIARFSEKLGSNGLFRSLCDAETDLIGDGVASGTIYPGSHISLLQLVIVLLGLIISDFR